MLHFLFFASLLVIHLSGSDSRDPLVLFQFEYAEDSQWQIVNDGVMGGRSQGFVDFKNGVMAFSGSLVTRGGGFTSARVSRAVDLTGYDGVELRVRGDGRTYEIEVDDGTRRGWRSVSRRAPFEAGADWATIRVPFSSLRATVFGRPVDAPRISLADIRAFGIYIADGIDGPFRLEVDLIGAYP